MKKINSYIVTIESIINIFFFLLLLVTTFLQVLFRYIFNTPLHWTEEMALYSFIWVIFFGSYVAAKNKKHIRAGFLVDILPQKLQFIVSIFSSLLICSFLISLLWEGLKLSYILGGTPSITMGFPLIFLYISIPISAFLMLMVYVRHLSNDILALLKLW